MARGKVRFEARGADAQETLAGVSQLVREYVSGSAEYPYVDMSRALPRYVDDAEQEFGLDLYERMMKDALVCAAVDTLRMRVMDQELRFGEASDCAEAREAANFVRRSFDSLDRPIEETLYDMLLGVVFGSRLAELVFRREGSELWLRKLAIKPRRNYVFLVDAFQDWVGVVGIQPGHTGYLPTGLVPDVQQLSNAFPASKFWLFRNGGVGTDPRGVSVLRPAYNAWWLKQQTWPQMLKYLVQFAGPSLIGYTPEHATTVGQRTPEELMLGALRGFQNGSIVVLRGGSKVERVQSEGEGRAFLEAIGLYNREMTHAILKQTRATMEAEHGSKADSETASDVLTSVVQWMRSQLVRGFERQVLWRLLALNFGRDYASEFCPRVILGVDAKPSFGEQAQAIAALAKSGYLEATQYPGIDEMLGLPARRPS